jgi:hypothetical protein
MIQKDYGFLSKNIMCRKSMGNNKIKDMSKCIRKESMLKSMMHTRRKKREKTMGT